MLHIFSKPLSESQYKELEAVITPEDDVLFTRDACYSLMVPYIQINTILALATDCEARNISYNQKNQISHTMWVDLTIKHVSSLSW